MSVLVPVKRLVEILWLEYACPWDESFKPIKKEEIFKCLFSNELKCESFSDDNHSEYWDREEHLMRIVYLVRCPSIDSIEIYLGCPKLGLYDVMMDGNHRLYAAWFRNCEFIDTEIIGRVEYAEEILNIKL